jgi:formate hydrogenlyase subunit 4
MLFVLSLVQLLYVALLAPLLIGTLRWAEERLQSMAGPPIFQPYYDLIKLFRRESVTSRAASPAYSAAPYLLVGMYLFLTLVLPIITAFPLAFGPTVDFIGGGLVFGAASVIKKIVALDSKSKFAHLGASRASGIGALSDVILVFVFIMLGVLSKTNNPYVINNVLQTSGGWYSSLLHWFVCAAFFMILIVETGQLPVESHSTAELGMIDQAMPFEYSGPELAIYELSAFMKQFLLMSVFLNVFAVPFWVPLHQQFGAIAVYALLHLAKLAVLIAVFAVLNATFSKYKLYKNFDFLAVAFALAFLASIAFYVAGGGLHS